MSSIIGDRAPELGAGKNEGHFRRRILRAYCGNLIAADAPPPEAFQILPAVEKEGPD